MARPKDADPERTRATILDAAEDEFADHGFHGTRMVAIAKRAGVTHGLLHYYFDSKDRLYEEVLGRLLGRHQQLFEGLLAGGNLLTARELVLESFDLFWTHPNQVRIMLWEMASGDDRMERSMKAFYDTMSAALATLTANAPPASDSGRDPRDVYVSILGALVVYFFRDPVIKQLFGENRFSEEDRKRRRAHIGALLDLLL
ncbi:MAG: TetR family transcriptional regulator [Deltaproteobacteria bacterium]|nr:TetR family transcriptional regulator [Deltaproteobacteria bacterium]MBW2210534.1 TetR family transcriptional regulator [Deltaproteobacteria bacterium]MBW2550685.1 TetR family transcriptional regulator [Deltaproteobacteria bacterium]MBW2626821.1 TetR family transcriptional regulator [Deltaproteobacteria bacterium]MBW2684424.1 TetR family transcriptional regulator [Deltaproteobacteria bacterium]